LKTDFVLVDFENVQPNSGTFLHGVPYKIKVFVGAKQAKVPFEMARTLQAFGPSVEYIQIDGHGKNALDFHIAYYIGRLAAENPGARFHLISNDTGFDPLIKHLTAQGISCQRSKSLGAAASLQPSDSELDLERVDAVIANLAKRKAAKPRTLKTLRSTINALFANQLSERDLDLLVERLTDRGAIDISDGKVHYHLSP
jgi:PIN domain